MQNRTLRAAVSTRGGSALRELCMTWRTFMEIDRAMQSAGCCIVTPPERDHLHEHASCTNAHSALHEAMVRTVSRWRQAGPTRAIEPLSGVYAGTFPFCRLASGW